MKSFKLNKPLIRKIIKHITEEPNRYSQEYIIRVGEPEKPINPNNYNCFHTFPACGTAACLGGWACILSRKRPHKEWFINQLPLGGKALGLSDERQEILFSANPEIDWPTPFNSRWLRATIPSQEVKVAVAMLKKVIETNGKVLDVER
jgi:hypothetical protein